MSRQNKQTAKRIVAKKFSAERQARRAEEKRKEDALQELQQAAFDASAEQ